MSDILIESFASAFRNPAPKVRIDHAARTHGCTRQTMSAYIKAGCPAHDDEAAREWIMQHRLQIELARFKPKGKP